MSKTAIARYEQAAASGDRSAAGNLAAYLRLPHFTASGPRSHWQSAEHEDLEVASFLRLRDGGGRGRTLEQTRVFGTSRGWLPDDLIPFALDHGGNFFALDTDGTVVFYTLDDWHEHRTTQENHDAARHRIASTLWEFVAGLRTDS